MGAISQAISQPRTKRRYRSAEERRRIVEETLELGTPLNAHDPKTHIPIGG